MSTNKNSPQRRSLVKSIQRRKAKMLVKQLEQMKCAAIAAIMQTASLHEDAGELDAALLIYNAVLASDATHVLAHLGRGAILMQQEVWAGSVAAFEAASRLDPKDALPHTYLGEVLDRSGQQEAAALAWAVAERLDPIQTQICRDLISVSAHFRETGSPEDIAAWDQLINQAEDHMRSKQVFYG